MNSPDRAPRIEDHGVIGDGRSAALIARDGTIDWLCWPRYDSDATFSALLHDGSAGEWSLHPVGAWRSSQAYLEDTNVLVTRFDRPDARVELTDLMPLADDEDARRLLLPEHELLRIVECLEGEADVELSLRLAPGFGAGRLRARARGADTACLETPTGAFFIRSERPVHCDGERVTARFRIRAGERVRFSLSWSPEGPAVLPPLGAWTDAALERTTRFWRSWARRAQYDGPYLAQVRRSALVLKLLQYPPSGAMLAAATTSLPESVGGPLNWDYRFCWLRDAAFTARCLFHLGYAAEAEAFVYWLMHTTQLTQPRLAILYDVFGNSPGRERLLDRFDGYRGSRPVRVGNAAEDQLQLDVHGEVIDAVCAYVEQGGRLDRESRRMLVEFGRYVTKTWHLPDASLWEYRSPPQHYTHSKALTWAALDGLLRLHRRGELPGLDAAAIRETRELVRLQVRSSAWNPRTGGYASVFGGDEPDAALLLLPWYGFEKASSPRMLATLDEVVRELGAVHGLLYRNRELREQGDGAFVACSFWAVGLIANGAGSLERAEAWFRDLLALASPLGLFAEEVDPATGEALGNFPQAYSHVGLITAAFALEARRRQARPPVRSTEELRA